MTGSDCRCGYAAALCYGLRTIERMIVASFLVKHMLHSWNSGAAWFWDTLVDADLASNT